MLKFTILLIFILTSFISLTQIRKFDPYHVLRNESVINIERTHHIDSLTYIIVARKEKATAPIYVQYIAIYDSESNEFEATELVNEKSSDYFKSSFEYIKTHSDIFRIRQNKNRNSLYLDKLENNTFIEPSQPFFSDDSLIYDLFPRFIQSKNAFYYIVYDDKNPEQAQCVVYEFDKSTQTLNNKTIIKTLPNQKEVEFRGTILLENNLTFYYKTLENNKLKYQFIQLKDKEIKKATFNDFPDNINTLYNSFIVTNSKVYFYKIFSLKEERNLGISIYDINMDDLAIEKIDDQTIPNETLILDYFTDVNNKKAKSYLKYEFKMKNLYLFDCLTDKNGDVYFFSMVTSRNQQYQLYHDILISKLSNDEIIWSQKVRRGAVYDSKAIVSDEPTPKSPYPIITNSEFEIELITEDWKLHFDSNGNYIPNSPIKFNNWKGNLPVKITIDKKTGKITRSVIQE